MRTSFISLALAAAILGAGYASAGQTSGEITSIDHIGKSVTLSDGTVYIFDDMTDGYKALGGFKVGDAVSVNWDANGDTHHARTIASDFSANVTGKVAALSQVEKTVTLDNGTTYSFHHPSGEKTDLGGYKVGDEVSIVAGTQGDMHLGRAIAPTYSAEVTGVVKSINQAMHTVTLEDGMVYSFDAGSTEASNLGGFRTGDRVSITATRIGDTNWGRGISPAS